MYAGSSPTAQRSVAYVRRSPCNPTSPIGSIPSSTLAFRFRDPDGDYVELYFGFTQDAAQRLLQQMQTLLPAR